MVSTIALIIGKKIWCILVLLSYLLNTQYSTIFLSPWAGGLCSVIDGLHNCFVMMKRLCCILQAAIPIYIFIFNSTISSSWAETIVFHHRWHCFTMWWKGYALLSPWLTIFSTPSLSTFSSSTQHHPLPRTNLIIFKQTYFRLSPRPIIDDFHNCFDS